MQAHADAGVEIVAVTDHNRVDWYPVLRAAGEAVGVYVFPGLEISVNGCHLIAVWDRTEASYDLAQSFLGTLWNPGVSPFEENGDPKPVALGQVLEIARRARDHRALVFAPHSTAKGMGLFARGVCRTYRDVAQSGHVVGFDVKGDPKADVLRNPRDAFGDIPPRWFISGDVRSLDHVGRNATYLKLAPEPTLEGIRQAFLMPDTRMRFRQDLEERWSHVLGAQFIESREPTWPRISSIGFEGGFHSGMQVEVAPGLNAVIGGKGTGKSTLLEILRYVTEAPDPLLPEGDANRRFNFKANAEATIGIVDTHGEHYTIHRSGDDTPARLLRNGSDTDVEVRRRFTVTVFGQRELQELANREELLREFVASQAGPAWETAVREEHTLQDGLGRASLELVQVESALERMEEDAAELKDIEDRLMRAREKGVESLMSASKALTEASQSVATMVGWPGVVTEAVKDLEGTLPAPTLASHPLVPGSLKEQAAALESVVTRATGEIHTAVQVAVDGMDAPSDEWEESHRKARHELQAALADAGIADPKELGNLQEQAAKLTGLVESRPETERRQEELVAQRRQQLTRLAEVRRQKSRETEEAARILTGSVGARVRVSTSPLADRSGLHELFERELKGQNVRSQQLQNLVAHAPAVIAEAMRAGAPAVEALGCTGTAAVKVAGLPPSVARACEETDIPDEVTVEIDLGTEGAENWMPVRAVSPGQRATALLALALASGTDPLIIDQPEDDLDNRYIYDEVVKVLGDVCKRRQVIVATHNANVTVLGDAELVIAVDADSGRGEVLALGGLESPGVAEVARSILEGGVEAFRARYQRYSASEVGSG